MVAEGATGREAESKPEEGEVKKEAGRAAGVELKLGKARAGSTRLPVKASEGEGARRALKSTVEVGNSVEEDERRLSVEIEELLLLLSLTALKRDSPPREVKRVEFNLSSPTEPSKPGLSSKREGAAASDPKSGESKSNATLVHCSN